MLRLNNVQMRFDWMRGHDKIIDITEISKKL